MNTRSSLVVALVLSTLGCASSHAQQATPAPSPAATPLPTPSTHAEFSEKIIKRLRFSDPNETTRVIAATTEYLDALAIILRERQIVLDRLTAEAGGDDEKADRPKVEEAWSISKMKYIPLREAYIRKLDAELTPRLVERVKDGLTHDTYHRLEAMYGEMIPDMTPEERAHVVGLLVEGRENAMLAIDAEGQKQWFDKYRGIINNYLHRQGHDFPRLSKAWDAAHPEKEKAINPARPVIP
jgi:Protein of unknown function (DUF3826)